MYNYIKGKLIESGENYVVVESGNIGYELNVSANTAAELSAAEGEVKIYCFLSVRKDSCRLPAQIKNNKS